MATQTSPVEGMVVKYNTLGKEITLNANIVRNYLTKGNAQVTDAEILQFVSICKYQELNPFLNEAYLVKFKNNRGGEDQANIIVSKEAFLKRAEGNEHYQGFKAGIVVIRNGNIEEVEGALMLPTDTLLGGWAEVYRDDRSYAVKATVNLKDYDKGRSTWEAIKTTMIRKVALVQALREAFPTQLGAMYTREEQRIEDVEAEVISSAPEANKTPLPEDSKPEAKKEEKKPTGQPEPVKGNEIPSIFQEL